MTTLRFGLGRQDWPKPCARSPVGAFFPSNHDVKEKDMNTMFAGIKRFVREEEGAAGVEYALLLTICAVIIAAAAPVQVAG